MASPLPASTQSFLAGIGSLVFNSPAGRANACPDSFLQSAKWLETGRLNLECKLKHGTNLPGRTTF